GARSARRASCPRSPTTCGAPPCATSRPRCAPPPRWCTGCEDGAPPIPAPRTPTGAIASPERTDPGRVLPAPIRASGFNGAVADSQYPYPPDRFDDEADAVSFHGAHRAELPFWRENLLYIIIIGAAAAGEEGGSSGEEGQAGEASEEAPPEADRSTPLLVVNAGGQNGLAGSWRDTLEGDGWEDVDLATADNAQEESVVFYRDEE